MAQIRRVAATDIPSFERVAEDVFDHAIDPARLAAFVADPSHLMVVAIEDGAIVGQARGMVHLNPDRPDELYIDNLGVAQTAQRQGYGRRLMDELIAWARELGAQSAWVGTESDNRPAIGLYRALGAEPVPMAYFEFDLD